MQPSWSEYYKKVASQPHRPMTELAADLVGDLPAVAVDCGCGVGRDTTYLLNRGFKVHAFDKEQQAIEFCQERFKGHPYFQATQSCFVDFDYPTSSLVMAHSSLFFCPSQSFEAVWSKLLGSLPVDGVLSVDLLGVNDSWVTSPAHSVTAFTLEQAQELLIDFNVVELLERDEKGRTEMTAHYYMRVNIGGNLYRKMDRTLTPNQV